MIIMKMTMIKLIMMIMITLMIMIMLILIIIHDDFDDDPGGVYCVMRHTRIGDDGDYNDDDHLDV